MGAGRLPPRNPAAVGDLWSRRAVVLAADVVRCASQGVTAVLPLTGTASLWHLAALQAVAGASFAVDAATFAVSAAALVALRVPARPEPRRPALLDAVRHGWLAFRARPWLRATTVQVAVINGVRISPFLVIGPIIAERRLGGPPAWAFIGNGYAVGAGPVFLTGAVVAVVSAPLALAVRSVRDLPAEAGPSTDPAR